ncbi:MAG: glycosyltransferase [Bdellovibrionales bacterium]
MKISGFTVVRNAILMGYPILESIKSILPLVDEFIVGVGQSDDETKKLIEGLNEKKIKIFDSFWDTKKTKGGLILSEKTNEALAHCQNDWCFYLQADEAVHEQDYSKILEAVKRYDSDPETQGLLFRYLHFYGSYHTIATARNWYRYEIRLVRKSTGIQSFNDAQGFRVHGQKPYVRLTNAHIHHYGWVKPPQLMGQKSKLLSRWWHGNKLDEQFQNFQYRKEYGLRPYKGTHPAVMKELVASQNWNFNPRMQLSDWTPQQVNYLASDLFESVFRYRIGEYKNYKLLRD